MHGVRTWFALVAVWPLVEEFLGWRPCLKLYAAHRLCIPTPEGIERLRRQLADFGLHLPAVTHLPVHVMVPTLFALSVSFLQRFDDPTLQGPWWHGHTLPRVERRVAIRYKRQAPRREWGSSVRGSPIPVQRVATAFPGHVFRPAIEFVQEHGAQFFLHRVKARRLTEAAGYVEGMLIEVTTLYCVIGGFGVLMRASAAHEFDPAESQSDSGSDSDL